MSAVLRALLERYPLSEEWAAPELFSEAADIGGFILQLSGLSSRHVSGQLITASSAETGNQGLDRCFFELLERTSVVESETHPRIQYSVGDSAGGRFGNLYHVELFPESPVPQEWRFSRSNGVAAHVSWELACANAAHELIERDRLLRSWFGQSVPTDAGAFAAVMPVELVRRFDFRTVFLPNPSAPFSEVFVAAVIGFPRDPSSPVVRGYAARGEAREAVAAAARECLQTLGFLWGGELTNEEPAYSPSPDYHQEKFLGRAGAAKLRDWLDGKHGGRPSGVPSPDSPILFADITPKQLEGRVSVVKACAAGVLPLVFGRRREYAPSFGAEALIHPIS